MASESRYSLRRLQQVLCRDIAQSHDDIGVKEKQLSLKILAASRCLFSVWVTVFGRTAFHGVSNVEAAAWDSAAVFENAGEKLARFPDERTARSVFISSRPFTDNNNPAVNHRAFTEDCISSGFTKAALPALFDPAFKFVPCFSNIYAHVRSCSQKNFVHFDIYLFDFHSCEITQSHSHFSLQSLSD